MSLDIDLIEDGKNIWSANITHNLAKMANKADLYDVMCLKHPNATIKVWG